MFRAADRWFAGYLKSLLRRPRWRQGQRHLMVCFANHFEPFRGGADRDTALCRTRAWTAGLERACGKAADADGRLPVQTFFYPAEEYDPEALEMLAGVCRKGLGETEVHLHHRNDNPSNLARTLARFRDILAQRHGALGSDRSGRARFGFVHGNWALCNSRPDHDWCGVNEELAVLAESGCYADFTFPSAPSPTQPRMVNVIYRARDIPGRPRGHDTGRVVRAGTGRIEEPGELMIAPGPLFLDWGRRKFGILPRLDNSGIEPANPLTARRVKMAAEVGIRVIGMDNWIFVKFHLHGCVDSVASGFLAGWGPAALAEVARIFNDGEIWKLHWVSAREMYNIIRAAEDGRMGEPGEYRDYELLPPAAARG